MGSLFEAAAGGATPPKRIPHLRPSAPATSSLHRLTRFLLSDKVGYLHWVFTVAAFLFVVALFQAFLPGSPDEGPDGGTGSPHLGEIGRLEFGDGIRFVPSKLLERWERERREANLSAIEGFAGRSRRTYGLRKPLLALVVPNLFPDAMQLQTISIAVVLKEIGYDIQIFSFEDGPVESVWSTIGLSVRILPTTTIQETTVDWLNYDGILVNSMISKPVISWSLLGTYLSSGPSMKNSWHFIYVNMMMYSSLDAGNFMVIPGCPTEAWEADNLVTWKEHNEPKIGYTQEDFVIAIVGGEFSYSGLLLEHALILEAIKPLLQQFKHVNSSLRICILNANLTTVHRNILEAIARNGGFSSIIMENIVADGNMNDFINAADIVLYGSFLEEQSIPTVLIRAMSLGKLVVAPDLSMISKYVDNGVNAYLFPKDKVGMVSKILLEVVSNGKLSPLAQQVASLGKERARNLMASETILGYVSLLEKVLNYPSEIAIPKPVDEIPIRLQKEWQWDLFVNVRTISNLNLSIRSYQMLEGLEEPLNHGSFGNTSADADKIFSSIVWEDEKEIEMVIAKIRIQEEELKDRTDQPHGTWDEVYRSVKRADRARNELHERDDRELERTGQPLCIYEPYFGQGAWPFLRRTSLYRGIGLSSKGRRPGADDIDASSRLPLLSDSYYRDVLGEYGAFFALGYHIDRVHKNAWIGFQSWRASAKKVFCCYCLLHNFLSIFMPFSLLIAEQCPCHACGSHFFTVVNYFFVSPVPVGYKSLPQRVMATIPLDGYNTIR
ncbi:hypothetical protein ZIOFF_039278 [Zingiber officinale]|uniref:Glycosyl transferase family 1 domain-containing protein n=1 Tax=Zingiber officinale TaxID=94328 RepID=A0A8J5GB04_ZINOF|nr:hypothetical protein ZIOFF_039278 [Zingiber officinale]